jgi:hypothetical protein
VARVLVKTVENRTKASAPYVPQSAVTERNATWYAAIAGGNALPTRFGGPEAISFGNRFKRLSKIWFPAS